MAAVRIDLHTHSEASPDGGLSAEDYRNMLASGGLQIIAVTDHNTIEYAQRMQQELGSAIIVGEEITAQEGEIIGLYLQTAVPPGLPGLETAARIREQGGLVYIPHPFETVRKGLPEAVLWTLAGTGKIDIIETYNGRTLQNHSARAKRWAGEHGFAGASSSDAHGRRGWGNTWTVTAGPPTRETLVALLKDAGHHTVSTGAAGRLYPKLNRLRKRRNHA